MVFTFAHLGPQASFGTVDGCKSAGSSNAVPHPKQVLCSEGITATRSHLEALAQPIVEQRENGG